MNIKRFVANTSQEALRRVKEEMGPDAVILGTRTISSQGGGYGNTRSQIEVTAAIDYDVPHRKHGEDTWQDQNGFRQRWESLEKKIREIFNFLISLEAATARDDKLASLTIPRNHYVYYRHFGVNPENLHLIQQRNRPSAELQGPAISNRELKECLLDILGSVKVTKEPALRGKYRIFAFVGPTGVGKTTTIAKLAAIYKVKKKLRVALVTVDTYRIGAVAQLETYARIMGLPLEVADNSVDLGAALERHKSADIILIDTAGRSPRKREDVSRIDEALRVQYPIYHYLVLSSNTELGSLLAAEEAFRILPIKSYIFTKLDETMDGSSMVNFLLKRNRPVSYFTTGQSVPEDIEVATRKRIGQLILRKNRLNTVELSHEVTCYGSGQPT